MRQLSDKLLIDTYYAAIEHQLEHDFILMLYAEMKRRKVHFVAKNRSVVIM